jgi:cobalamin-dependent methionine synthase I
MKQKKALRTQAEWAVAEVDRWMDRLESRRTLAPDWNIEFWPAVADYLEEIAVWIREQMEPSAKSNAISIPEFKRTVPAAKVVQP